MNPMSRRAMLAVAAVVDIAIHARPVPVTSKALAGRHDLPPRYLETVLQALVRYGILKGVRGPRGGYEVARERRRVSVGDIVRAAGDERGPAENGKAGRSTTWRLVEDVIAPTVSEAGEAYLRLLDAITVEDLCDRAGRESRGDTADFTI